MPSKTSAAVEEFAPTAREEFTPTAPSHDVYVYRGQQGRRIQLGSARSTERGTGLKIKLDHMPQLNAAGNIEQICIFPRKKREEADG